MTLSVPVVQVHDVSKRFVIRKEKSLKERILNSGRSKQFKEDFWALKNVDLEIESGSTIGLMGSNGSGKSTLLKAIGGIIEPTSGFVKRRGRLAALLELGAGFHPDLTGRENVYLNASILGLSRKQTDFFFDDIVEFSGIETFIDTQVKFYSSGMYMRLAFAVAIHVDPDLLLVDEVLAVGDEAFQRKCLDKIRSFQAEGRTIILVTHSLGQVQELCDRAVLLNAGAVVFDGEPHKATVKFRDILEDRRLEEVSNHVEEEVNQGEITNVSLAVAGKGRGAKVVPGDDLEISMTFEHKTGLDNWMAALQIDSVSGQVVYGTTTHRAGLTLKPLRDAQTVTFTLRDVNFGSGKYFISASLMNTAGVHIHDLVQAVAFDVPYYDLAVGTVYVKTEVSAG
ncbi:ABC transporter ATP-binding protein [Agreia sp. COWG]|uniref:ABC transporter ATP-binding protein n=1 Tax=Agreia sp. COWG TaxID=2773266 RepID=UPI001927787F|nr:ABC transporter ATP-binding protein [Agreia sp. COWG]CAD5993289.1 ABC transporter ATP-binding protein [Agreia sp. COWG]